MAHSSYETVDSLHTRSYEVPAPLLHCCDLEISVGLECDALLLGKNLKFIELFPPVILLPVETDHQVLGIGHWSLGMHYLLLVLWCPYFR
jgi:hypothetical protein